MKDELDLPSPDAGSSCERELQQQIDSAGCESSNKVELEARGKNKFQWRRRRNSPSSVSRSTKEILGYLGDGNSQTKDQIAHLVGIFRIA
jgi:hypothetical protein